MVARVVDQIFIRASASPARVDEGEDLADGLLERFRRQIADAPRLSSAPVKALDLIREDRALDTQPLREPNLEGIALHLRGDGAAEGQPDPAVVGAWRDHHRGAMTPVLVARLRAELEPDQVP